MSRLLTDLLKLNYVNKAVATNRSNRYHILIFIFLVSVYTFPLYALTEAPQAAPEWELDYWINSEPLKLSALRGKVILVRWWTAPDCPYCSISAAALNQWHSQYSEQGLVVIGIYHHKKSSPLNIADVGKYTKLFKFEFPVAIDLRWRTLRHWLPAGSKSWTSASFIIGKYGKIHHIHSGGAYTAGDDDYKQMDAVIQTLLQKPYPTPADT